MSKIFGKIMSKLMTVLVIVIFIVTMRQKILTDPSTGSRFGALMENFPFAHLISDTVCDILKYKQGISSPHIPTLMENMADFLKLAIMTVLTPIINRFLYAIFLPMPEEKYKSTWDKDDYMESPQYKSKEMMFTLISAPFIASLVTYLVSLFQTSLTSSLGEVPTAIIGSGVTISAFVLSIVTLMRSNVSFVAALLWRLLVTILPEVIKVFITNAFVIVIYLTILNGEDVKILGAIGGYFLWLVLLSIMLRGIKLMIASLNVNS